MLHKVDPPSLWPSWSLTLFHWFSNIGFFWPEAKKFPFKEPQRSFPISHISLSLSFWFQTLDSRCSTWLHIKVDYQLEPNIIHLFPEKHNHQDLLLYHNIERPQTYRYYSKVSYNRTCVFLPIKWSHSIHILIIQIDTFKMKLLFSITLTT